MTRRLRTLVLLGLLWMACPSWASSGDDASTDASLSLPEEATPLAVLPERPRPLLELGQAYLAPTPISQGFELPTGAVWQPSLLAWGTARSALQGESRQPEDRAEWANRLDLFGQLSLTATERFVVGVEPLQTGPEFTGYRFAGGDDEDEGEFVSGTDVAVDTLFFEGDVGEIFPRLDRDSWWPLDLGFMVGRVPVVFQDGLLVDDRMAAFGLVQNSILARGTSNLRVSLLTAWDEVHRGNNASGGDTKLFGLFSELDRSQTTWALDAVYADGRDGSDGVFGGLSAIRRLRGRFNLTARVLGSLGLDEEDGAADDEEVEDGLLGVLGLSAAPPRTHDVAYLNVASALGHYTPAARSPDRGGPLGRVGILFEAPGLGSLGAPIESDADRVVAGALGYQKFFGTGRTQLVLELGGRARFGTSRERTIAAGLRLQQAFGRRLILRLDGHAGDKMADGSFVGGRGELLIKF